MNKQPISHIKILVGIVITIALTLWLGIPMYRQWQADKLVDELCAKDGGVKVYETVILPADRFSKFDEIFVPEKNVDSGSEYYYSTKTEWIIPEGSELNDLDLRKVNDKLFRASDEKLLGESIGYSRRGGDIALLPMHPSHYKCSFKFGVKYISQRVFIQE